MLICNDINTIINSRSKYWDYFKKYMFIKRFKDNIKDTGNTTALFEFEIWLMCKMDYELLEFKRLNSIETNRMYILHDNFDSLITIFRYQGELLVQIGENPKLYSLPLSEEEFYKTLKQDLEPLY